MINYLLDFYGETAYGEDGCCGGHNKAEDHDCGDNCSGDCGCQKD